MPDPSEHLASLDIPSTAPLFLAVLAVHVPAGLTAVVSGAVAALTRKGTRRHLGATSFVAALVGRAARRRHWAGDRAHILGMGISYVALLTAFYVDNGPQLPGWDRLPAVVFWFGPATIGVLIIRRALGLGRGMR